MPDHAWKGHTNLCISRTAARRQCPRQQCFTRARRPVKEDAAGGSDAELLKHFGVEERERDHFFELVDVYRLLSLCTM
jgi:hypothetical protein